MLELSTRTHTTPTTTQQNQRRQRQNEKRKKNSMHSSTLLRWVLLAFVWFLVGFFFFFFWYLSVIHCFPYIFVVILIKCSTYTHSHTRTVANDGKKIDWMTSQLSFQQKLTLKLLPLSHTHKHTKYELKSLLFFLRRKKRKIKIGLHSHQILYTYPHSYRKFACLFVSLDLYCYAKPF